MNRDARSDVEMGEFLFVERRSDAPQHHPSPDRPSPEKQAPMPDSPTPGNPDRKRKLMMAGGVGVAVIVLLGFGAYWFVFRDTSAAPVNSASADEARQQAIAEAQRDEGPVTPEPTVGSGVVSVEAAEDAREATEAADAAIDELAAIEGTWTIDGSIGTFNDACLTDVCNTTFVGFRINEELANIGAKTVVGRAPGVSGTLTIEGTAITATEIAVDMTGLITDDNSRTKAIRNQAIETTLFPDASFSLTEPVDFGALPADGEEIIVDAVGDLTIHGVTRSETISLTTQLQGEVIVVFGQLGPILLADYEISEPRAAVVLSVEDNAIMELQLFFTRS